MKHFITLLALISALYGHKAAAQCTAWNNVGPAGFTNANASDNSIVVDASGNVYVAYKDASNGSKTTVKKYNGSTWTTYGGSAFSSGSTSYTSMTIDSAGTLWVVYRDNTVGGYPQVMKNSGLGWTSVGGHAAGTSAWYTDIAVDNAGTPYVSFRDQGSLGLLAVNKWTGTGWYPVGPSATIPAFYVAYTSIALDTAGMPYVAFSDGGYTGNASVMKWDGTAWSYVGPPGFSAGPAAYTSLAIDSNNTLYLAYQDGGNLNKVTVMKYAGTSWTPVGSAGFSTVNANSVTLALDKTGTPSVCFSDAANGNKATAMRFNGTSWNILGTAGFTPGQAGDPCLALDTANVPYVVYTDVSDQNKLSVKKLGDTVTATLTASSATICQGVTAANLTVSGTTGGPTSYSISWSAAAAAAGFSNISNAAFPGSGPLQIAVPVSAPAGTYTGTLTVANALCTGSGHTIQITVTPSVTPSLSITGPGSVCTGTSASFNATVNIAGGIIQWMVNNLNVGTNSTNHTYTPANNDQVTAVLTVPAGCFTSTTDTSNLITVSVASTVAPSISVSGSNSVCSGTTVNFTATTNVSGGTIQWKVNNSNSGSNSTSFSYIPSPGDQVTAEVTTPIGGCYTAPSASANTITMTVTPTVITSISITGTTTVCAGSQSTLTATTNVTGASFQWQVNGVNSGTNSSSYTFIPASSDQVRVIITPPAGCFSQGSDTSNTLSFTVTPNTTPTVSITAQSQNVCAGTQVTFNSTTNITGGSYQWKVNGMNNGTNSNSFTYVPAHNDVVTLELTAPAGCYSPATVTSNSITMSVNANTVPTISISAGANNVCAGTQVTFTATTNTSGTILWYVNNIAALSGSTYTYTPANNDVVEAQYTAPATGCYSPTFLVSNTVTMTVLPNTTPAVSISGDTVLCGSSSKTYTATTNVTGASFQWKVNNLPAGTNSGSYTYSPANGDLVFAEITTPAGCYTATTAVSNSLTIDVNSPVVPTASLSGSTSICSGTQVSFNASTNVLSPASYQWYVNGVPVGPNSGLYTYAPANNDQIYVVITTPASGCYTISTVTSNTLTMSVQPSLTPTIAITGPTAVASGVLVVLNSTVTDAGANFTIDWKKNGQTFSTGAVTTASYTKQTGTDTITAIVTPLDPGCFTASVSNTHYVDLINSIRFSQNAADIGIYPNPADNQLTISGIENSFRIRLTDLTGKLIQETTVAGSHGGKFSYPLQDVASGSYMLTIIDGTGRTAVTFHLVKK